ncbi:AAA family ATPase [Candidatus Poribacteria bacterium]|nr:AAA family ATPase [Candidatus Poribacteria bacterium]MBT5533154.1 AAA family ATPase [Candidatus Poribacteria bacterium]MBT5713863.1 AAA family ATPase [Candidatus Poribacteria bacterium]MBT7095810.1 AAA family ATPase [Candidatus Poribacteria bacterium]MBT7806424.1 AAA family ATPase [Candidatus Poribacteria bacterium]
MNCGSCGYANGPNAKFCSECGAKLERRCPECAAEVRPDAKFCDQCGTNLTADAQPSAELTPAPAPVDPPRAAEAERRHLTVMFCDLVGSSSMAESLDPEELREVVRAYQHTATEVIESYAGHTAQYLGDGLLVYFGYPVAHEDDAQRAVRAGLGILDGIRRMSSRFREEMGVDVQVRIGVHTGLVVIGEVGGGSRREDLALGDVPNVAARLQGLAEPGELVVSATAHHLVRGFFDCEDLGPRALRGISQPMNVHVVRGERDAQSRRDVSGALTPFMGREQEMGLLRDRWELVRDGAGQAILLNGEAGIGKSRFTQVFQESLAAQDHKWIEARCSPYHENSAFYPIIEMIRANCGCAMTSTPEEQVERMREHLEAAGHCVEDDLPHFAALLDLPANDGIARPEALPEQQKQKTIDAVLSHLLAFAVREPIVFVVEDLHWADPSTLEFVTLLIEHAPTTKMLLILTYRPVFQPPWRPRSHVSHVTLNRLPKTQMAPMITHIAEGKVLPDEVLEQILARTDGVPLFVEELTKMVIETGLVREGGEGYAVDGPLAPAAIPTTLHDSLTARLDRLAPVKEVAQLGAAIGREFGFDLLAAVSPMPEAELRDALQQLVEAELVFPRGIGRAATFVFKHALIRDAAYQSLLKSSRQQYHRRIATALEERFPEIARAQPEVVAHHYSEAGLTALAVEHWRDAGDRARERSALAEAEAHFTRGLDLLATAPDSPERDEQELFLTLGIGATRMATEGYTAPRVAEHLARARELAAAVDRPVELGTALLASGVVAMVGGELVEAHGHGTQLYDIARDTGHGTTLVAAHFMLGMTTGHFGRLREACEHLDTCIELVDAEPPESVIFLHGQHPRAVGLAYLAMARSLMGMLGRGARAHEESLEFARTLNHPFTTALVLGFGAQQALTLHGPDRALELADELLALTAEHDFPFWLLHGSVAKGRALVERGAVEEGLALLIEGSGALHDGGGSSDGSLFLGEAYLMTGKIDEGLDIARHVRSYIAEIHEDAPDAPTGMAAPWSAILEGGLLAAKAEYEGAERCFTEAIDISRPQESLLFELQATMGLGRVRQSQGRHEEGAAALQAVYDRFTEGSDLLPLVQARALLDELRAG